jgi:hypothetical protein
MRRYIAVWDDGTRTPLNGDVVFTKERFACDWRTTDGSVICYSTTSTDGEYYTGSVLDPRQRAVGTFTSPVAHSEYRVQFRCHPATKQEPWIRMEYIHWETETQELDEGELCDILLLPESAPKRTTSKKAKPAPRKRARKR